jgi:uncharacterized protein
MAKLMQKLLLIMLLLFLSCIVAAAQDVPQLRAHVNDYAGMLSPATVQDLERKLADFERSDSTQIVVLTIPTLGGDSLEDYSIKVAEAWRVGQKGVDNGIILLIAQQERKIRIEVGRGLEGKLTDLLSGRIIRDQISPLFKTGDIDGGVTAGVAALMEVVRGEYKGSPQGGTRSHTGKSAHPIFTLAIFLMVAIIFLGSISRYLGGLAAGVGLPLIAWYVFPGIALAMLAALGVGGFVLGLLLSFLFGSGGGGGGFSGGGPFIGGGFFGGGFGGGGGGFSGGGGDFGGGGASGDW